MRESMLLIFFEWDNNFLEIISIVFTFLPAKCFCSSYSQIQFCCSISTVVIKPNSNSCHQGLIEKKKTHKWKFKNKTKLYQWVFESLQHPEKQLSQLCRLSAPWHQRCVMTLAGGRQYPMLHQPFVCPKWTPVLNYVHSEKLLTHFFL